MKIKRAARRSRRLNEDTDYSVAYGYAGDGRFASVSGLANLAPLAVQYSYLPGSHLIAGWSSSSGLAVTRTYEPNRDLLTAVSNRYNGATVSAFDYVNDAVGRRTRRMDVSAAGPQVTNDFGYNLRSELTSAAMGTNSYGYAYDPIGNRTAANKNAEAIAYVANALNQYTSILSNGAPSQPLFDADGNLTNYNGWAFTWDAENRLVTAVNGSTVVSNTYDYMSRRVAKTVGGTTRTFIYDGWNLLQESAGTTTNSYVWGLDLSGTVQGAGGIGGLLSVNVAGTNYYACADANGNIQDYVNDTGTVVAHREFDAYGNTVVSTGPLANQLLHWFSTKYLDEETGFYYYGYRFYDPVTGRWLSRDPVHSERNLYAVVANALFDDIDALGLADRDARQAQVRFYTIDTWSPMPQANDIFSVEVQSVTDVNVFENPSIEGCRFLSWRAVSVGVFGGWLSSSFTITDIWILLWIECEPIYEVGKACDIVGYNRHNETDGRVDGNAAIVRYPPNRARPEKAQYIAHERGHVRGVLEEGRTVAKRCLSPYIGMTTTEPEFIQRRWDAVSGSSAASQWRNLSDRYANSATVAWFSSSPKWKPSSGEGRGSAYISDMYWERK